MKPEIEECKATAISYEVPNHEHSCIGNHAADRDHFCGECMRHWLGQVKEKNHGNEAAQAEQPGRS